MEQEYKNWKKLLAFGNYILIDGSGTSVPFQKPTSLIEKLPSLSQDNFESWKLPYYKK
ncbi:unnamed protein product [Cunninghamella blakesleeana]